MVTVIKRLTMMVTMDMVIDVGLSSRIFVPFVKCYVHGTHVNIVVVLVLYSTFAVFFRCFLCFHVMEALLRAAGIEVVK